MKRICITKIHNKGVGGLKEYNANFFGYKYDTNLNEILNGINYMYAEEKVGKDYFHNEKMSLVNFFLNEFDNIIGSPKGTEYFIRFESSLPRKKLKEDISVQGY